ncbi:ABC transporter ATP-binding protein [Petroclostridium sp. X23]|uniref:ABC transporter ATP-binding protein n=1 Tax=Petroclostridium sp. X23 TaxID=3045146 RepID=UPI0024AE3480|nr:ABC transporter ATP-binding protein [Petroclostridium sp. X23]WHH58666.1 ABC transporter ATP-binding protein [Petroclostridium sp. X23]
MILKIDRIKKSFDTVCVLNDFSMKINEEEIVCIIGPSGCGKSTLLNIISGLLVPSEGEIINNSPDISYVFQEDRLLPWKNVYENIKIVNKKCSMEKCLDLIRKVGLEGFEGYYPSELSGGMRQRCSIARAFNYDAGLLLMDEPFKSLDYNLRLDMIRYLLELWESTKKSIVFVTHEIDEALLLGDRILILSGRPARVIKEFDIKILKAKRSLAAPQLVKVRNEIIYLLQDKEGRTRDNRPRGLISNLNTLNLSL